MAVIVLNWELGADLGHIGRFLPLALRLRERGHRPVMLLRDITRAEALLGPHGLSYLQAPVWMPRVNGLPPELNLTETLFRFGFLHPEGLLSMCKAWRASWALLQPALMVFDHAPTALLAARGLGIPRLAMGNSFAVPLRGCPMPPYRWWEDNRAVQARLAETEARATRNANAVLGPLGAPLLHQVSDLYEVERSLVCSHPAMDVYGQRETSAYIGPINNIDNGVEPVWPEGDGPAVFAYLKPGYAHFEAVLDAMNRHGEARFLVYAPGTPEVLLRRHTLPRLRFSAQPLRMRSVVEQCAAVVCHAGGVTDVALQAGRPVLLLPAQMEQLMTSQRVVALGVGGFLPLDGTPQQLGPLLERLIQEDGWATQARGYAQTLPAETKGSALEAMVEACNALLMRPAG